MQTIEFRLSPEDKKKLQEIQNSLENLEKNFQPKEPPKYYSRAQLAKMFGVNISTVYNWVNSGVISSIGIGGRVYFTQEAIDNAIVNLKK
ncbi:MAG: DNA-binding protein [Cytophagaceae bacterium]|nr:DNA-binding protein [Cytophagaceae bacterium]|tara:strand:+ start:23005 stop:23274 length:270 start_codon:yes stop_codon:yes gene_type:complete